MNRKAAPALRVHRTPTGGTVVDCSPCTRAELEVLSHALAEQGGAARVPRRNVHLSPTDFAALRAAAERVRYESPQPETAERLWHVSLLSAAWLRMAELDAQPQWQRVDAAKHNTGPRVSHYASEYPAWTAAAVAELRAHPQRSNAKLITKVRKNTRTRASRDTVKRWWAVNGAAIRKQATR